MNTNNQVFKAFLKVNGMELPIYPRSTKTSIFTSIKSAVARLEVQAKKFNQDTTGIVYRYENCNRKENVYQMAL
jgi:hypothetical protein